MRQADVAQRETKTAFYYLYVLCTGAAVMALELDASRFLAPYFGTSMLVWANIIGMILLALSVGYWVGGRMADKYPSRSVLMTLSLLAGLWMLSVPLWGHLLFRNLSGGILNTPLTTIVLSLAGILLVFVPPVFLLAMVSPYTIRMTSRSSEDAGKVAGNLYAFSTIGSLVGTFGTAFGTIPFLGVTQTLLIWSGLLVVVSLFGLPSGVRVRSAIASVVLFTGLGAGDTKASAASHSPLGQVVWQKDTLYQHVGVVRETNGATALIYNEGGGVQSVRRPGDALDAEDYYDDYLLLPYLTPEPVRSVAVIGSAAGTIPHLLSVYDHPAFPDMQVTGVEIDGSVLPLGSRYFGLKPEDATLVNEDGRTFIRQTKRKFDLVIVDAYINEIYIPSQLSTREFFQEVRSHLQPDGITALNMNVTEERSPMLLAFEKTLKCVYPYVYDVKARGAFNHLLIASMSPVSTTRLERIPQRNPLSEVVREWPNDLHALTDREVANGMLLTDNHAPVEMLTDSMIFSYAGKR